MAEQHLSPAALLLKMMELTPLMASRVERMEYCESSNKTDECIHVFFKGMQRVLPDFMEVRRWHSRTPYVQYYFYDHMHAKYVQFEFPEKET